MMSHAGDKPGADMPNKHTILKVREQNSFRIRPITKVHV
jgi:hypothetical protein